MPDQVTRRYVVSGRVQGVGFRWFVEREAAQIGIAGWVRNCSNGDVEVMATGTREQHPDEPFERGNLVAELEARDAGHLNLREALALTGVGRLPRPRRTRAVRLAYGGVRCLRGWKEALAAYRASVGDATALAQS